MDESLILSGFWRRFCAALYDLLLASAVCVLAAAIAFAVARLALPLLWQNISNDDFGYWLSQQWWYRLWLFVAVCSFYVYCWSHGGQTLGMAAWRIRLVTQSGHHLSWRQALLRFFCCLFGLSNLLLLFNTKRGLQDILCRTQVVVLPKVKKDKKRP